MISPDEHCCIRRARSRSFRHSARNRVRAGLSEPGHPADLRISGRQRRRHFRALFRREAASARGPHRAWSRTSSAPTRTSRPNIVARSKPDGHVLYPFAGTTVAASMHLFKNPPVDVGKALRVAATTSNLAFMLTVDAKSPYKTVAELTAAMKTEGRQGELRDHREPRRHHGRDLQERCRARAPSRCRTAARRTRSTKCSAAASTMRCTIRSLRSGRCARAACALSRSRPASGCCRSPTSRPWRNPVSRWTSRSGGA